MHETARELESAVEAWKGRGWPTPDVLLVAGSGLGIDLGSEPVVRADLADILPFPVHEVIGHAHAIELLPGPQGSHVLYQRGRLHAYQEYDAHQVVFMVRLAARLGARALIMSNAAGGIRKRWKPGDLRLISDHINLIGLNPLSPNLPPEWGHYFQDMADAYSPRLRAIATEVAAKLEIPLEEGVYAGLRGPSFETPAEVRMVERMGADLVGMSTVLEVIAARQMGLECLCFSLVSNAAAGTTDEPVRHDEVLDVGRRASERLKPLLTATLEHLLS